MTDTNVIPAEGTTPEVSPNAAPGDGSTPAQPQLEDTLDGGKIDLSKMSEQELKGYKTAQSHFTKFTQKYKTEQSELSGKLKSYESLLGDELIRPLAHYRTYGKLPDGIDPQAFATQLQNVLGVQGAAQAVQPDSPDVDDNTKAYIQSLFNQIVTPLQQRAQMQEALQKQETNKKANESISNFRKELSDKDPKLGELFQKYAENGQLKTALEQTPFNPDFKARLKFAFNGLTADEYIPVVQEKTRAKLLEELKVKSNTERPLSNGASGGAAPINKKDLRAILSDEFDKISG